jgi:hypothetical protein
MSTMPTKRRKVAAAVQCSSSTPIGTPTAPPSKNGIRRASLIDRRSFQMEMSCTISP